MAGRVGRDFTVPTTRGEIRWHNEPWGAVVVEHIYQPNGMPPVTQTIRLPWSVINLIEELSNDE